MRSRLVALVVLVGLLAACTSNDGPNPRSMPNFNSDRRVEQINSPGR